MNILITGTSSGLGFGLAKFYLEEGHQVYGISRKTNVDLDRFDRFKFKSIDLADFESIQNELPAFLQEVENFDLILLNAGVLSEIKDLKDTSLEEIERLMNVNVWANKVLLDRLLTSKAAIRQVVAISSGASVSGSRGWNAYSLSKATLNMLMKLYASEDPQTHFSALAPGLIDTQMQDYIYALEDATKYPTIERLQQAKGTTQMPGPDEAAKLVASAILKATHYPSGEFLDVRKLPKYISP